MKVMSPLGVPRPSTMTLAPKLQTLKGAVVGLVDNSKPGAIPLLKGIADELLKAGVAEVREFPKNTASAGHPQIETITRESEAVVLALGD